MRKLIKYIPIILLTLSSSVFADDFSSAFEAYKAKDYQKSIAILQPLADSGNVNALSLLGRIYSRGEGVPKDIAKGLKILNEAKDKGSNGAFWELGQIYEFGIGVNSDFSQALSFYKTYLTKSNSQANIEMSSKAIARVEEKIKTIQSTNRSVEQNNIAQQEADIKKRELELKQRELALKENELKLKESKLADASSQQVKPLNQNQQNNVVQNSSQNSNQQNNTKVEKPIQQNVVDITPEKKKLIEKSEMALNFFNRCYSYFKLASDVATDQKLDSAKNQRLQLQGFQRVIEEAAINTSKNPSEIMANLDRNFQVFSKRIYSLNENQLSSEYAKPLNNCVYAYKANTVLYDWVSQRFNK